VSLPRLLAIKRRLVAAVSDLASPVSVTVHLTDRNGGPCPDNPWAEPEGTAKVQVIVKTFCGCPKCTAPEVIPCARCGFFFDHAPAVSPGWVCPRCRATSPGETGGRACGEAEGPNSARSAAPTPQRAGVSNPLPARRTDAEA
jgi:hypothetical protein